jgi:hypothetical protein
MPYPHPAGTAGISLLRNGDLVPEVEEIMRIVAEEGRALATGHISPLETKALVERARQMGLHRILVNHASSYITNIPPADQKELVKRGAFIEHCYIAALDKEHPVSVAHIAEQIKEVGPEHCVISTDLGQPGNPEPSKGLEEYVEQLLHHGLRGEEIEVMVKENPLTIIGLD